MAIKNTPSINSNQAEIISQLVLKIEQMDAAYMDNISNEIYKFQPFYLSTLLGFSKDVSNEELGELMKVYFLVWESFRSKPGVKKKKVKEKDFARVFKKIGLALEQGSNTGFITPPPSQNVYKINSKELLNAVLQTFNKKRVFVLMDPQMRLVAMLGIIAFIECFEKL